MRAVNEIMGPGPKWAMLRASNAVSFCVYGVSVILYVILLLLCDDFFILCFNFDEEREKTNFFWGRFFLLFTR